MFSYCYYCYSCYCRYSCYSSCSCCSCCSYYSYHGLQPFSFPLFPFFFPSRNHVHVKSCLIQMTAIWQRYGNDNITDTISRINTDYYVLLTACTPVYITPTFVFLPHRCTTSCVRSWRQQSATTNPLDRPLRWRPPYSPSHLHYFYKSKM